MIVDPERILDFLASVAVDPEMTAVERALLCLIIGSGGRISEILALKKNSFTHHDGDLYFVLRVLKKDHVQARKQKELLKAGKKAPEWTPVEREAKVPDVARALIAELLLKRRPHERLFRLNRFQALRIVKRLFGDDVENHSFRHSYVSWLGTELDSKPKHEQQEIAELMKMSVENVPRYFHIANVKRALKKLGM